MRHVWIDGQLLPETDIHVSPYDVGLVRGYGVCDLLGVTDSIPVFVEDHLNRFINSQKIVHIEPQYTHDELRVAISDIIKNNDTDLCPSIRLIASGGYAEDGLRPSDKPVTIIQPLAAQHVPDNLIQKGIAVKTHKHQREFHEAKTLAYASRLILEQQLQNDGFSEVLYHNGTHALEASTSNLFIIKNKEVFTPKKDILHGITRKKIIESIGSKYKVHEQTIPLQHLFEADEIFITATNKSILPVIRVDETPIGNGQPGPITKDISHLFTVYRDNYISSQKS